MTKISKHVNTSAFTLIELLTCIAVIAILAAILIPAVSGVRERAQMVDWVSNTRSLGQAHLLFMSDNQNRINGMGPVRDEEGVIQSQWDTRIYPYLAGEVEEINFRVLNYFRDELKPTAHPDWIRQINNHTGWAINNSFSPVNQQLFRSIQYENADQVIYAIDGFRRFSPVDVQNSDFVFPAEGSRPSPGERVFFPYSGQAVALFLDGHTELISAPIKDELVVAIRK